MCKINVKIEFYHVNICRHEHEKNMTRLWCKIMPKMVLKKLKEIRGRTSIYTPLKI